MFAFYPTPMAPFLSLVIFTFLFASPLPLFAQSPNHPTSRISVVGVVFCDACFTNTFSRYSYFLPGVDVQLQCTFKANSPRTAEQIDFSVNRTTNRYGIYKLEIPQVDGVDCVDGNMAIELQCQATLLGSSNSACNVSGLKSATNELSIKSKKDNHCIYSLNSLSYRPLKINTTLCRRNNQQDLLNSFNSSDFFLPYYFPPYGFPWPTFPLPPLPSLPPLPPLPPLPSLPPLPPLPPLHLLPPLPSLPPLPPLPSWPFPTTPPSLPFPFPPTPSLFHPPPPPAFNLGDPRTWIPNFPPLLPPAPPPPPVFNLRDPRTWIPHIPSSPPSSPQQQNP